MLIKELLEGKTNKAGAPKPRNFVAKNAINTGAGAHKDKKKATKQGDVKHKKQLASMAEERTEVKDKDGKVTSWKDEGEWRKSTVKKDSRGKVTNLSDKARRETEKLSKKEKDVAESATAGATSAANVGIGVAYKNKTGKTYKNSNGTVKNAADVKGANLISGGSIAKR
jgi:hypothetical protein